MLMVHVVDLMTVVKTTICGKVSNLSRVAPFASCRKASHVATTRTQVESRILGSVKQ
jgi:hypothetical protein